MLYMYIGKMLEEQLLVERTRSQHIHTNALNTINQITYDGYNMITLRNSLLGFQSDLLLLSTNGETSTDPLPLPTTTSTTATSYILPLSTPSPVNDATDAEAAPTIDVSYHPFDQHTHSPHPASGPALILNQDLTSTATEVADNTTSIDHTIPADHTTQHTTNTTHTHPVNSSYKEIIGPDSSILTSPPETNTVLDQLTALHEVQQRLITRLNDLERGSTGQNYDLLLSKNDTNNNDNSRGSNSYGERQVVVYNNANKATTAGLGVEATSTALKWASTSNSSGGNNSSTIIKAVIYKNNNRDTYNNDDELRYTFKDSSNNNDGQSNSDGHNDNDQSNSDGHNSDPFLTDDITVTKRSLTRRRSRYSTYTPINTVCILI